MVKKSNINRWLAAFVTPTLLLTPLSTIAGQQMKCVDGSGRVIFTELNSCAEAFRANPLPSSPPPPKSQALIESERRVKEALDKAKFHQDRANKIRSDARQKIIDMDYRERQRLIAEEEDKQKECEAMLVESDRRYKEALHYASDGWWLRRSEAYDRNMEAKCGHEPRLRR